LRPYTIVFSTMTADGRIADDRGFSRLSCNEDFELLHSLRAWADGVMVGARTAILDNPSLTTRLAIGRSPIRVVLDGSLQVPPDLRVFEVPGRSVIITRRGHPQSKLEAYRRRGIIVIESGTPEGVNLTEALEELRERLGVRRLLVEGGGLTIYSLLREGLLDELWITIAPYVFGAGTPIIGGPQARSLGVRLYLMSYEVLCGGWVNLRYKVLGALNLASAEVAERDQKA